MVRQKGLRDCRVIIKDLQRDVTVADTHIMDHDPVSNSIWIRPPSQKLPADRRLGVLVFEPQGLREYAGSVTRGIMENEIEVRLFRGKVKEARSSRRYTFHLEGEVRDIRVMDKDIPLRKPIAAQGLNISANGILLRSLRSSFRPRDRFKLYTTLNGKRCDLVCEVVRLQNGTLHSEEYGCRILKLDTE